MSLQLSAQIPACSGTFAPSIVLTNTDAVTAGVSNLFGLHVTINGNFTINQNVVFKECWIHMTPCASITILSGNSLTVDSTCVTGKLPGIVGRRWRSIKIFSNGGLTVINNSYISDADTAVHSINGGKFFIDESYLTDNLVGLRYSAYNLTHPGVIRNTHIIGSNALDSACLGTQTVSVCGIHVIDNYSVTIGDAGVNALTQTIEKQMDGIFIQRSSVTVIGTRISDINYGTSPANACIRAHSTGSGNYTLKVGEVSSSVGTNCRLDNSDAGMLVYNGYNVDVYNSKFDTLATLGIAINPLYSNKTVNIKHNTFTDCVNANSEFVVYVNDVPGATVEIDTNEFNHSAPYFNGRAIFGKEIVTSASWKIAGNKIRNKYQGIRLGNTDAARILSNEITGLDTSKGAYGIYIANSSKASIEENTLKGNLVLSSGVAPAGIIIDAPSTLAGIYCNTLDTLGHHIYIYSDANFDYFDVFANNLNTGSRGITVKGDGGVLTGCIGQQGDNSINSFADNYWSGPFGGNRWLYADSCGSVGAPLTIFTMRSNAGYDASGIYNGTNILGINFITITDTTSAPLFDCSGYGARHGENRSLLDWQSDAFFEDSPENILYHYQAQRYKYLIEINQTLASGDLAFLEEMSSTNIPLWYQIQAQIASNDLSAFNELLNTIQPVNELEELYLSFYTIYLDKLTEEEFVLADSERDFITYVSGLCPNIYGKIVGYAQSWLGIETEPSEEQCTNQNSRLAEAQTLKQTNFKAYPNPSPSNTFFTLRGIVNSENAQLLIYNLFGRKVKSYDLKKGNFDVKDRLEEGIYFIHLYQDNQPVQSQKMLILK